MKKFILTVLVLLIVGFAQFVNAQLQAPASRPKELVFIPDVMDETIWVHERSGNDLIFIKEVKIPEEIQKIYHPANPNLLFYVCNDLNLRRDSFSIEIAKKDTSWHFMHIFLNNSAKRNIQEWYYFSRTEMKFKHFTEYKPAKHFLKLFFCWMFFIFLSFGAFTILLKIVNNMPARIIMSLVIGYIITCLAFSLSSL